MALRIVLWLLNLRSKNYFHDKNEKKGTKVNKIDIDLEFQEAVLPVLEIVYFVSHVIKILLLALSFKWPGVTRTFLAFSLFTLAQLNMLPNKDHKSQLT